MLKNSKHTQQNVSECCILNHCIQVLLCALELLFVYEYIWNLALRFKIENGAKNEGPIFNVHIKTDTVYYINQAQG